MTTHNRSAFGREIRGYRQDGKPIYYQSALNNAYGLDSCQINAAFPQKRAEDPCSIYAWARQGQCANHCKEELK